MAAWRVWAQDCIVEVGGLGRGGQAWAAMHKTRVTSCKGEEPPHEEANSALIFQLRNSFWSWLLAHTYRDKFVTQGSVKVNTANPICATKCCICTLTGSQCKKVSQLVSSFCVLLVCKYACRVDIDMQSCIARNDDVIWKLTNKWGNIFCFVCVRVCFCAVFFILSNYALS